MNKDDILKILVGVALLVLGFTAFNAENPAIVTLAAVLSGLVVLALISLGGERATELFKMVLRFAFGNVSFLKGWQPSGAGSVLLAFIVAYAGVNNFDISLFSEFEAFSKLDPQLVSILTTALIWIGSSIIHNALPAEAGKAQEVK